MLFCFILSIVATYVTALVFFRIQLERFYAKTAFELFIGIFRRPYMTLWASFNVYRLYRLWMLHVDMSSPRIKAVMNEVTATLNEWVKLDYRALTVLYPFGKSSIEHTANILYELEIDRDNDKDGFEVFMNVLKTKDVGLSEPMLKALCDCVEEIRNVAISRNPNFADPAHALNATCGASVLVRQIQRHLAEMISVTG